MNAFVFHKAVLNHQQQLQKKLSQHVFAGFGHAQRSLIIMLFTASDALVHLIQAHIFQLFDGQKHSWLILLTIQEVAC